MYVPPGLTFIRRGRDNIIIRDDTRGGGEAAGTMAQCTICGSDNAQDKRFCTHCGAPLDHIADSGETAEMQTEAGAEPTEQETVPPLFQAEQRADNRPPTPIEPPQFELKAPEGGRPPSPTKSERNLAADDDEFPYDDEPRGFFDKRPWLVNVICYGILAAFMIPTTIALTVKIINGRKEAIIAEAEAKKNAASCAIKVEQQTGYTVYQANAGTNTLPVAKGECLGNSAMILTGPDGRLKLVVKTAGSSLVLFANNRTRGHIEVNDTAGGDSYFELFEGEVWVELLEAKNLNFLTPAGDATMSGPGRYHVMYRENRAYFTTAGGSLTANREDKNITVGPAEQLTVSKERKVLEFKRIDLASFKKWVDAWKDNFNYVAARVSGAAVATPEVKKNQIELISSAVRKQFTPALPSFVKVDVEKYTDTWAIAVAHDTRPNADQLPDFQRDQPVMLKNIDGHWQMLEKFDDYTEEAYQAWSSRYGFTKDDEIALEKSYVK